jgi:hypothetical protein
MEFRAFCVAGLMENGMTMAKSQRNILRDIRSALLKRFGVFQNCWDKSRSRILHAKHSIGL